MKSARVLSAILGFGLVMNLTLQVLSQQELKCDDDEDLVYPPECANHEVGAPPIYFPVPYDCRKYFECSNGIAHCFRCPVGTIWNQTITVCDHEASTECVIVTTTGRPTDPPRTTTTTTEATTTTTQPTTTTTTTQPTTTTTTTQPTTTTTTTQPTTTTTTQPTTTTTTTQPTTTTTTTTELPTDPPATSTTTERPWNLCPIDDPMPPPGTCPNWEPQPTFFPYPYDCQKYFQCTNGVAICMRCANGTVWDQGRETCAFESEVGCVIVTTTVSPAKAQENGIVHLFKKFL